MEVTIQRLRSLNRLIRVQYNATRYKSASPSTVLFTKTAENTELVNSFNRDIENGGVVPVFRRALLFPSRVAVQDEFGIHTYAGLYEAAAQLSQDIANQLAGETGRTISYMCGNDALHIIVQWAIWMSGNISVPLTPLHPQEMLKYFMTDSDSALVISTQDFEKTLAPIVKEMKRNLLVIARDKQITAQLYQPTNALPFTASEAGLSNVWYGDKEAMLIYTSGTTSKPKGVVWTHSMLDTQIASLQNAWRYSMADVVLHTLPLHHIHGQLNSVNASFAAGARLRMLPSFASHTVWARLLGMGETDETKVTVFHGVPAMYARLAADHEKMFTTAKTCEYVKSTLSSRMRLMCAGSAPLPETLFHKWEQISGLRLLERYGMSEVGMALSNPYRPLEHRTVGHVGKPLPGVAARISVVDPDTGKLKHLVTVESPMCDTKISLERLSSKDFISEDDRWPQPKVTEHVASDQGYEGELLLKGPAVFSRYWNRAPKLDDSDFVDDEWFRTGDTASFVDGKFRILGRTSIDIIKTSGYKVSALQVESALLENPNIADAAVLGVPHEDFGEVIACVVVAKQTKPSLAELRTELGNKLAPYQLPKILVVVDQMPRNAMGKLDKKEIRKLYGKELVLKK